MAKRPGPVVDQPAGRQAGYPALALLGVIMVWVLSSAASRARGLAFFVAGMAWIAILVAVGWTGRRRLLFAGYSTLAMATVSVIVFEVILHLFPGILGGYVANVAYTGYHWQGGGIYELDVHSGPILRPSVRRWMYWNGHWWWHETNANGYRGSPVARAEAVFLGDSMIYGHGVEADDTVAARYQALTGRVAANLGQQGTSLIQSLLILRRLGLPVAPKAVFVCAHPTDLDEALRDYAPTELQRFLTTQMEDGALPLVRDEYRPLPPSNLRRAWSEHVAMRMRCSGILGALVRSMRDPGLRQSNSRPRDPFRPTTEEMGRELPGLAEGASAGDRLPWLALVHALVEMKRLCDGRGARLVVFDLGYPAGFTRAVEETAREAGATYSPAGRVALERSLQGEDVYLASDGHWSPRGAAIVARQLALVDPR